MVSLEDVYHVAKLSKIEVNEDEARKFRDEFEKILEYFNLLDEAPESEPMYHVLELINVFREDSPKICLTQNEALMNTRHKEEGYFKGPKVME
ncbi:MAG: Asp-tRNA(Asn)/Glu-tRNA(Gln) amidotransferase subunit GatC [Archaeoglobaceae archaeon]|nr:Asp-tRNA(Asn)/Glu-tRNA(Gln) amidotransferase subunit GatC [Archaeoglobaceae archaeon]MCX8152093.1 Asp-tRNA(Asn)/Glu-tRNA(Gln) amidotransferase subunit GatC [Archaeoglobaceae archaeon]MDW8013528.1 Asp-tRNA(Asn)/Glu-tRNA(Gln) amidotransferase subunit GatC [Archaeoglobaceae archaeon]